MDFKKVLIDYIIPKEEDGVKDNKTAIVDGVYMRNHPIRKAMMKHIWAKYNMLPDNITNSLGKLYDMVQDLYTPDKNWKDILSYTHDGASMFSKNINNKYLHGFDGNTVAEIRSVPKGDYVRFPYDNENFVNGIKRGTDGKYFIDVDKTVILTHKGQFFDEGGYKDSNDLPNSDIIAVLEENASRSRLLSTTAKLIKDKKINTLYSRFASEKDGDGSEYIDSTNKTRGISKGKTLPNINGDKYNGYDRSYCRTWAWHKQYESVKDLIRPHFKDGGNIESLNLLKQFRTKDGGNYLKNNGVLRSDGFVQISPSVDNTDIKKCMFSIENLAWKDVNKNLNNITDEQVGPNGGRIMWFPPYDLSFQENVTVNWNETNFIGRGEPIYTYTNTKRSGTLNFTMLIDHPSIINGGIDKSSNTDEDLLRYFTGDNLLSDISMAQMKSNVSSGYIEERESLHNPNETIESNKEGKKLSFFVYFPNNYSGNFNDGGDRDWLMYITEGVGAGTGNDENGYSDNGYEMGEGGISSQLNNETPNNDNLGLFINSKTKNGAQNSDDNHYYKYRVDSGLNMKYDDVTVYSDTSDFSLNKTKVTWVDENLSATTSFNNFFKGNYGETHSDFKNAITGKTISKVEIIGFANNQYTDNAGLLANKRALTIKKWLLDKLTDNNKIEFSTKRKTKYISNNNINSKEAKESRCVFVEISYNAPQVEGGASGNTQTNNEKSIIKENVLVITGTTTKYGYSYINEYEYFRTLGVNDKFLFDKLIDRFKYFSPAFHSITPEGFNSRLNFLHQCTRQGHTIEARDDNQNIVAGNLAFGRPPFCVLRIGDFINTKIVIKGITITYENGGGMQWDLNPEGIGVQPMYAKINMQIDIIGGQSLDAPISRLNNAISFNYYANTGVYDHRADMATYKNGKVEHTKLWNPVNNYNRTENKTVKDDTIDKLLGDGFFGKIKISDV